MMGRATIARQAESRSDRDVSVKEGAGGAVLAVGPRCRPERRAAVCLFVRRATIFGLPVTDLPHPRGRSATPPIGRGSWRISYERLWGTDQRLRLPMSGCPPARHPPPAAGPTSDGGRPDDDRKALVRRPAEGVTLGLSSPRAGG